MILGAAIGASVTVLAGTAPGGLLGVFVIAATAVAAFAVRRKAGYLIIPVPALAYVIAAMVAGLIRDRAADVSHTILAVDSLQWIASGFLTMTIATALAILVALGRWLWAAGRTWRSARPGGRGGPAG